MSKLRKTVTISIVLSEIGHVFCCVLPTIFSVLTLLAGAGLLASVPVLMIDLHDVMHAYELPIIGVSGLLIVLGWALHATSLKMDCHDSGCCHPPCTPAKRTSSRFLVIATVLFVVNVAVYMGLHRALGF